MEIIKKAWELGLASVSVPNDYDGVGLSLFDSCLVVEELAWGCAGMATSIMCNDLGLTPILVGGSDVQKKEWLGRLHQGLHARLVLPLRAGRRLGRRGPPAPRREGRRPLRPERHQVLDHERRRGRRLHRLRDARPHEPPQGHLRVRRSTRSTPGRHRRQEGRQDGPARERHARDPLRQRARARRAAPRPGGRGLQDRDEDARPHAAPRSARSRAASRAARSTRAVAYAKERKAFGFPIARLPGRAVHARRHGEGPRGRAPPHAARARG